MKRRKVFSGIIILGSFLLLGYLFYNGKYSNEGILKNVTARKGYTLNQMENKEMVELYIKPEWIPYNNNRKQSFDIKLAEKHNTNIILVQVWNRGDDIYFSFDTTYNLNYKNGTFMYNGIFNEDGTFTSGGSHNDFYLFNKNGEEIDVGQSGRGPNSAFGFAIEPKNYDLIKDGFYVEYRGFYLYNYVKN
ncbi:hypothetical protein PB01_14555 [Psychrobacillus glaciei]|uniref:Uncharacterized protein n=1 Tax=Psychrobacillus glaciei TaxID=2283160 RepID=A0A5J6SSR9_9BACI|nr:hypothetical protein [Psychrobacillus glaciei]QFF99944.1 hypothetical protein PB01_14555 [Psychrobacillus glaciei]